MQKTTFKCLRSGNCVSFTNENDIEGLRKHEGYIEVKNETKEEAKTTKEVLKLKKSDHKIPSFLKD